MVSRNALKCLRCGWKWEPRLPEPVQCPRCKSYKWKEQIKKGKSETRLPKDWGKII